MNTWMCDCIPVRMHARNNVCMHTQISLLRVTKIAVTGNLSKKKWILHFSPMDVKLHNLVGNVHLNLHLAMLSSCASMHGTREGSVIHLRNFIEFYGILKNFAEFYGILRNFTEFC